MKKKWLSYMFVSALLSGALTSCNESKFLDLKDPNHFTNENFWRNKADAESALAAAYSPIKYQMNGYYGAFDGWLNLNSRGDDIFTITNEEQGMWDIANFANSVTTGNDPFGALYTGIQRANVLLRYIDDVPASGITDADRAMIKGEALVLRAYQYFLLVVLTVNAVGALWCKYILVAVLFMLMLIVVIEQIIHTTYTLTTNGDLEVSRGRFIRKKIIPLSEITAVRKYHSMKFGSFSVTDYILIEYGKGKFVSVMPVKEQEFAELLEKRMFEKKIKE